MSGYEAISGRKTKRVVTSQGRITRTHSAKYRLTSDTQISTAAASTLFSELSGIYEMLPLADDILANCRAIDVTDELTRDPWQFIVDVEWSTETPDSQQPTREQDDPYAEPVEIETDDELVTFPLWKDRDDVMIANTLKEPLAFEGEESVEVVTMIRNEPRRDGDRDRRFRNAVNKFTFSGAAPGTVKIRKIACKQAFRKSTEFWVYRYELAYKASGWQPEILNASRYELVGTDRIPIHDDHNEPVTEPWPIDSLSVKLEPADLPASAHFLTFNTLREEDFAELGLPE